MTRLEQLIEGARAGLERNRSEQPRLLEPVSIEETTPAGASPLPFNDLSQPPIRRPQTSDLTNQWRERTVAAEGMADEIARSVREDLTAKAYRLYWLLVVIALMVVRSRGYSQMPHFVTFHIPQEVVMRVLGIRHRGTIGKYRDELQALGLLAARDHKTSINGATRSDGYLWCVKLNPGWGKAARLSYDDLKHQWRDLAADIDEGRTAYTQLQEIEQSRDGLKTHEALELLSSWALPRDPTNPPLSLTVQFQPSAGLEAVLDVRYAPRGHRREWVDIAAKAANAALGDHSLGFYRWLMWQLLRLSDRGQDYFDPIYEEMLRAKSDRHEGFARSAGALFVSRTKAGPYWELLQSTPPYQVATA